MTLKVTVGRTLMRTLLRVATTSVAAVATYYFVYWFGGALLGSILPGPLPNWIAVATSLLIAIFVTCYVWMQSGSSQVSLFECVALGSLVTGTIGFSVGFFGPMLFTPQAKSGSQAGNFRYWTFGLHARCYGRSDVLAGPQGSHRSPDGRSAQQSLEESVNGAESIAPYGAR